MMKLRIGSFRRNSVALLIFVIFYITFGLLLAYNQERVVYQLGLKTLAIVPN